MTQPHTQGGRLQGIQTAVHSDDLIVVFLPAAVIGDHSDFLVELRIDIECLRGDVYEDGPGAQEWRRDLSSRSLLHQALQKWARPRRDRGPAGES